MSQLALAFQYQTEYSWDNFFTTESNQKAVQWVKRWPEWRSHCLIVYGRSGSGKTHLAHLWQHQSKAIFLTSENIRAVLKSPLSDHLFIIDDADTQTDEEGFFHLYNAVKEHQGSLFLLGSAPPSQWGIKLLDLQSRLNAVSNVELKDPDDALLSAVLLKLFSDYQIRVEEKVIDYILKHIDRSFHTIQKLAKDIENLQRKVTIPLVKDFLRIINSETGQ
jgi:chromosomal replication initiation ATPase DnaA